MKLLGMRDMFGVQSGQKIALTVAIEGPDRVGKATQAGMLCDQLRSFDSDLNVFNIEIPFKDGYTHRCIYNMLHDDTAVKYPTVFQSMQLVNRVLCQSNMLPLLLSHDVILFDRWNASMYAYGLAAGITHDELMLMMQLIAVPDITIVLDGDPYEKSDLDSYERDMKFQQRVRCCYKLWVDMLSSTADFMGSMHIVNANDNVNIVSAALMNIVRDRIVVSSCDNVIDMSQYRKIKK